MTLSSWAALARTAPCSWSSSRVDPWPSARLSKRQQLADDLRRIDDADFDLLSPRERHELLDEIGAAFAGISSGFELLEHFRLVPHLFGYEVEIADEHRQQVVEVVRDSGREAAQRLHARAVLRRDT